MRGVEFVFRGAVGSQHVCQMRLEVTIPGLEL